MAGERPCIVQREKDREPPRQRSQRPEVEVAASTCELSVEVVAVNHVGPVGKHLGNMGGPRRAEVFDSQVPAHPMGGGREVAECSAEHPWALDARIDGSGE